MSGEIKKQSKTRTRFRDFATGTILQKKGAGRMTMLYQYKGARYHTLMEKKIQRVQDSFKKARKSGNLFGLKDAK